MVTSADSYAFDTGAVRFHHVNRLAGLLAAALALMPLSSLAAEYNGRFPQRAPASATDRVLVKWRATTQANAAAGPASERLAKLNSASGLQLHRIRELAPRLELLRLEQGASGAELERILARLRQDPAVQYAVADQRRWPHFIPSDALFGSQWHVQSTQPCSAHVPHERTTCFLSASRARNTRTPALVAEIPSAAAKSLTGMPSTSIFCSASAYSGFRVEANLLTQPQISFSTSGGGTGG